MKFDFLKAEKNTLCQGASDQLLAQVQETLGIKFPNELIEFLKFSDGCVVKGHAIFFSCGSGVDESERILNFNNPESVKIFLRIGRFSENEFGYRGTDIQKSDPAIYILNHETDEVSLLTSNLTELLEQCSQDQSHKRRKWYSFLFQ